MRVPNPTAGIAPCPWASRILEWQSVDFKPEQLWTDSKGRHHTFVDVTAQRGGNKLLDVTVPYF
jgi:hypothetical protein